MDTPSPKALAETVNISPSYASMIISGSRTPPIALAVEIFRKAGWKPSNIAHLNEAQIAVVEEAERLKGKAA